MFTPQAIPQDAGCYMFYDENDDLLYVGKAKNLRKRVSSYFQKTNQKKTTHIMVSKIRRIETHITHSEIEALILENNLVKQYMPRFNIRLRDDKNFVYLRITKEERPKMEITRRRLQDKSTYIGPKTSTKAFKNVVRFCQKFFHVRMVDSAKDYYPDVISGKYDIDTQTYQQNVERMKKFLQGQTKEVEQELVETMMKFASEKNFEAAQNIKETLNALHVSTQNQSVTLDDSMARDFVSCIENGNEAYCVRISFREGRLIDQNEVVLNSPNVFDVSDMYEAFLIQFYETVSDIPREIYIPVILPNEELIQSFLCEISSQSVLVKTPQRGEKKTILDLATKRALHFQKKQELETLSRAENFSKALPELALSLNLEKNLSRIECFDISHFSGDSTVASQVVFLDGTPAPSEYRRFSIKTLSNGKIDDFASMKEVLSRRFARKNDTNFAKKFPDLIVIDGGKGQLSSVWKAVESFLETETFPDDFDPYTQIIALAKKEESIFRPHQKEPLLLPFDSSALKLLQRIRDEAHRFAITYNRKSREKKTYISVLDEIPGIGAKTKKELLKKFESASGVKQASDEQLLLVLSQKQLQSLRKYI